MTPWKRFLESKAHVKNVVRNVMLSIKRSFALLRSFFDLEGTRYAAKAL
jgi:hypothetical protein